MSDGDRPATGHLSATGWVGPPPRSICIVMLSAIGDAVHVLPVANALKRAWPETRITWVVQPLAHRMVTDHPAIDDFIIFHRRRGLRGVAGFIEAMDAFRGRHFDLLIGLQVYLKAGILTGMAPARIKLGFDRRRARDGQWLFTTHRLDDRGNQHVADQYLEFVTRLGLDPEPVTWGLDFTDEERRQQRNFFAALEGPACALVMGTSKKAKNWTAEGYARVAESLESQHGLQPVLVGGPSKVERTIAAEVIERSSAHVVDALGDDLRRLMWILDGSRLVVSPDTGPLHIARALDRPVVSLFGYTNPKRSGPWRACEELVVDGYADFPGENYPLAPVYRDGMKRVTVEGVLEKISLAMNTESGALEGSDGG